MLQYARECGKYDSIVGDGYALLAGTFDAAQHVLAVKHAGTAVYHKVIRRQILGVVSATNDIYLQLGAKPLTEYCWELHTSDILILWCVGTGLGDEDTR